MKKYLAIMSVILIVSASVLCLCACEENETYGLSFALNEDNKSYNVSIGECTAKSIDIPSKYKNMPVTEIARNGFAFSEITEITLPDGLLKIGDKAFARTALTLIRIPESVTVIGEYAFSGCTYINEIDIPQNVSEIGVGAFASSGFNVVKADNNPSFRITGNCLIENATGRLIVGCNDSVIPDDGSVKSIEASAFYFKSGLKNVVIPSSVKSIGTQAFYKCASLKSITIPATVEEIGFEAFGFCEGLEKAEIGVKKIFDSSFTDCVNLTEVTTLDGVETIGTSAFNMCVNLEKFIVCSTVNKFETRAFYGCEKLTYLEYVGGSSHSIRYEGGWNENSGLA